MNKLDALFVDFFRVDVDGSHITPDRIPHDAFQQIHFAMNQGWNAGLFRLHTNLIPKLVEEMNFLLQEFFLHAFGRRSHDQPAGTTPHRTAQGLQADAFIARFDFARDADLRNCRHQNDVTAGQSDVGRNARALCSDRLFGNAHQNVSSLAQQVADSHRRDHIFHFDEIGLRIGVGAIIHAKHLLVLGKIFENIIYIEKGITAEADIYESGFHARENACDAAFVDVADNALVAGAFNVDLNQAIVF